MTIAAAPLRRVLIVSPHFPPINAPDMQRVRMSLPYYSAFGWQPVVLTVREADQEGVREPELEATVPAGVTVLRCRALPPGAGRRLGIGNLGLRAWWGLWRSGRRFLATERCDLVFFSNTQFITFLLGPLWRRRFGVPYVLDFQDPWRTDHQVRPGAAPPPGGWKHRFARVQARWLEERCVRGASGLISVSAGYLSTLAARYPGVERLPAAVLPFGASPSDLALATRQREGPGPTPDRAVRLVYTGAAGPMIPEAAGILFRALRRFREQDPAAAARLRFEFVGTSYAAAGRGAPALLALAERCGVADRVSETPARIGFLDALRVQRQADVLFLAGSTDLAYSPSKLHLYFLTGRPILALVFAGSVLQSLLTELGGAHVVVVASPSDTAGAEAALAAFFHLAVAGRAAAAVAPRQEEYFRSHYQADELTRRQCALFDAAVPPSPAR